MNEAALALGMAVLIFAASVISIRAVGEVMEASGEAETLFNELKAHAER